MPVAAICKASGSAYRQGWGLLSKIRVKFHVCKLGFSNMASDWLAAVLPANQMPGLKIFVNWHGISHGHFLVTRAPGTVGAGAGGAGGAGSSFGWADAARTGGVRSSRGASLKAADLSGGVAAVLCSTATGVGRTMPSVWSRVLLLGWRLVYAMSCFELHINS